MKLVIDISKDRYKDIQRISNVQIEINHFQTAEQIIANGTPLPDGAEILTIDKRTLKAVTGRFVIYDREWLKEHFNTTEAYLYGGTKATDVPDINDGDLISRQELLDAIFQKEYGHDYDENTDILGLKYVDIIKGMPSVEPERKTGKWIVEEDCEGKTRTCTCNLCGYETGEYTWVNPNYCENCGAKMEVDE